MGLAAAEHPDGSGERAGVPLQDTGALTTGIDRNTTSNGESNGVIGGGWCTLYLRPRHIFAE